MSCVSYETRCKYKHFFENTQMKAKKYIKLSNFLHFILSMPHKVFLKSIQNYIPKFAIHIPKFAIRISTLVTKNSLAGNETFPIMEHSSRHRQPL